jgi:hypothetical protein
MHRIFQLAEELLASQEGVCYMELGTTFVCYCSMSR